MAKEEKPIYRGGWQIESIIRQELEGPIDDGEVVYPNGDRFRGSFHLSYQSIWSTAYTADGRYDFADGSYIEHAWINTSSDRTIFDLHGLFRVKHPDGPDSITMYHRHKRYGIELFLDERNPYIREWFRDELQKREHPVELLSYELDESKGDDCLRLTMNLKGEDGTYIVEQCGGLRFENEWRNFIYKPQIRAYVKYPDGDSVEDRYGIGLKLLRPYDFYVRVHCGATAMLRGEKWKDGKLEEAEEWRYDRSAAMNADLPYPWGRNKTVNAYAWANGHIEYTDGMIYDGDIANDMPEGTGILTSGEGGRYEGEFHSGCCHGKGVYTNEKTGVRQKGVWVCGVFQEDEPATKPIILHARHGHSSWSISSQGDWTYEEKDFEAELGELCFSGFGSLKIDRIQKNCITLSLYGGETYQLTPGGTVQMSSEIEGREYSDGCVYDGDDYTLRLTWKE